jgi:hypothetical protein
MKELTHFIGGKHANDTSGRFCDGFEPMTGEVISRVPLASKAEVRAAVENAIAAQAAWAATNPQRRARVLIKFLELVARAWPLKSSSARLTPRKFLIVSLLISIISPFLSHLSEWRGKQLSDGCRRATSP